MKNLVEEIVEWLQKQLEISGQKGFVLGLSGGIDSSVVAQLVMKAAPGQCLGVIMPAGNQEEDRIHGIASAEVCGMPYFEVDLTAYRKDLSDDVACALEDLGYAVGDAPMVMGNVGARLRMTTLYAVGNAMGYLVVGTDNMDESYTGYFTKYGDGGVDLLPIAHLTKGEVFSMGEYLGVPDEIIKKKPSAGFFQNQTDEEEMGVDYATIDRYLNGENISLEKEEVIERLHSLSQHKRMLPPTVK